MKKSIVEEAKNQPMSEESIKEKLKKAGYNVTKTGTTTETSKTTIIVLSEP